MASERFKAFEAFAEERYSDAISAFTALLSTRPDDPTLLLSLSLLLSFRFLWDFNVN